MDERVSVRRTVEAIWRIESARLVGGLVRSTRDLCIAEDLAQEAFVAAMEQWPESGVPENPGAWLNTTARRRAIDRLRRERRRKALGPELHRRRGTLADETIISDAALDGVPQDDVLRLIFMTCHPELPDQARTALTLRLVCGLSTDEIARGFLVPEATIAQRIVRAKRTLSEAPAAFEIPSGPDLPARLASVLEVVYLLFNEGYSATSGGAWTRPELCAEAQRLGRILAAMMPHAAEVHGLLALMEFQASRLAARTDESGRPILLADQNRAKWDQLLIRRGHDSLDRARRLNPGAAGSYTLQASIAACHARARTPDQTDWERIVALYEALQRATPSPVVALNHAVAVAMSRGPAAGLELADRLADEPSLGAYHLLPSVRGEFLRRLGRHAEAAAAFDLAATFAGNDRERELLLERANECRVETSGGDSARSL